LVRNDVIDVADETQGYVIIFRIEPACARQPATQHGQRLAHLGGNFETCEETRHGGGLQCWLCIYDKSERFARPMRCSHRPSAADLPDQFFYLGQNARNDRIDACGARMKSIALIERALASNAVEEKGVEQEVVTPGQLGIDGIEIAPISTIEI